MEEAPDLFNKMGGALVWNELPDSAQEHWWVAQKTVSDLRIDSVGEGPATPWGRRGPLITISLTTRLPGKYLVIDRETGDQWEQRDGRWKRAREHWERQADTPELEVQDP